MWLFVTVTHSAQKSERIKTGHSGESSNHKGKRAREEERNIGTKEPEKMTMIISYLLTITLNIKG